MAFNKITDSDLQGLGVTGLPDVPGLDSAEMQKKLDELALYAIERLNLLVDELEREGATKEYVNERVVEIGAGDMAKSSYDSDGDGIVDDAQKLGGHAPEHYAAAEALALHSGSAENPHAVTKAQVGLDKVNNNSIGMVLEGTTLTITYS